MIHCFPGFYELVLVVPRSFVIFPELVDMNIADGHNQDVAAVDDQQENSGKKKKNLMLVSRGGSRGYSHRKGSFHGKLVRGPAVRLSSTRSWSPIIQILGGRGHWTRLGYYDGNRGYL